MPVATITCMLLLGDNFLHEGDVTPVTGGQVHERLYAACHDVLELRRRLIDFRLSIDDREVLFDAGRLHDDVLVHEGKAEVGRIDRTCYGINGGHGEASFLRLTAPIIAEGGV